MGFLDKAIKIIPFLVEAISFCEKFIRGKGKAKQDSAISLVMAMLGVAEEATERDLLSDSRVEEAARKCCDAIVALQNAIKAKEGG